MRQGQEKLSNTVPLRPPRLSLGARVGTLFPTAIRRMGAPVRRASSPTAHIRLSTTDSPSALGRPFALPSSAPSTPAGVSSPACLNANALASRFTPTASDVGALVQNPLKPARKLVWQCSPGHSLDCPCPPPARRDRRRAVVPPRSMGRQRLGGGRRMQTAPLKGTSSGRAKGGGCKLPLDTHPTSTSRALSEADRGRREETGSRGAA